MIVEMFTMKKSRFIERSSYDDEAMYRDAGRLAMLTSHGDGSRYDLGRDIFQVQDLFPNFKASRLEILRLLAVRERGLSAEDLPYLDTLLAERHRPVVVSESSVRDCSTSKLVTLLDALLRQVVVALQG